MFTLKKNIHNSADEYTEKNNGHNQEVIVVDGRGYENNADDKKQIYTLVDIIENPQVAENLQNEVMKRAVEIIERIAREKVPEIAERIIREEIEKITKTDR